MFLRQPDQGERSSGKRGRCRGHRRVLTGRCRPRPIFLFLIPVLLALTAAASTASAPGLPVPGQEAPGALRPAESSAPLASLDAYLRGQTAWQNGHTAESIQAWEQAANLDPRSLPPRLALVRALATREPGRALEALQEASGLVWADFRTQRWLIRNGILALALAGTLAVVLLCAGLLARHLRGVHHLVMEALAWSIGRGPVTAILGWGILAVPLLGDLGILATLLFWAFLCAFRFGRSERILAAAGAAWSILVGPTLLLTAPLWAVDPMGLDASLVRELQADPLSRPARAAVARWTESEPDAILPHYLSGLAASADGEPARARAHLEASAVSGDIPPAALEVNLGNTSWLAGDRRVAVGYYRRAAQLDPTLFAAYYNQALVLATEGRFTEADQALEQAAVLDLDRLRRLGRASPGDQPRAPVMADWTPADLWAWTLRHRPPAAPPEALAAMLPLRSVTWGPALLGLAITAGLLLGGRLGRLLRVRVCYQCGRPICRRCLVRVERRAYCLRCGNEVEGLSAGDSTRLLIRKLLEARTRGTTRLLQKLAFVLPGVGPAALGYPVLGAVTAAFLGLALALAAFPHWGSAYLPLPVDGMTDSTIRLLGYLLAAVSVGLNFLGLRGATRRQKSLRAFLSRDVDRLAA